MRRTMYDLSFEMHELQDALSQDDQYLRMYAEIALSRISGRSIEEVRASAQRNADRATLAIDMRGTNVSADGPLGITVQLKNVSHDSLYVSADFPSGPWHFQCKSDGDTEFKDLGHVIVDYFRGPKTVEELVHRDNLVKLKPGAALTFEIRGSWYSFAGKPSGKYEMRVIYKGSSGGLSQSLPAPILTDHLVSNILYVVVDRPR
jgi:hypothetical protein